MWWAPALANASNCCSGRSIIRCTSSVTPRSRSASTAIGPIVIGGTKWPSITSTWMTEAPAATTSSTWARSWPKSAARMEGAIRRMPLPPSGRRSWRRSVAIRATLNWLEHAGPADVAFHDGGVGHAHDGGVLPAVGAHRCQLEPVQAVHAAVAARERGGAQPGFAAIGAAGAEIDLLGHRTAD